MHGGRIDPFFAKTLIPRASRINPVRLAVFMGIENLPISPGPESYLTVTQSLPILVYAPAEHID
jgi:hypothetical protein